MMSSSTADEKHQLHVLTTEGSNNNSIWFTKLSSFCDPYRVDQDTMDSDDEEDDSNATPVAASPPGDQKSINIFWKTSVIADTVVDEMTKNTVEQETSKTETTTTTAPTSEETIPVSPPLKEETPTTTTESIIESKELPPIKEPDDSSKNEQIPDLDSDSCTNNFETDDVPNTVETPVDADDDSGIIIETPDAVVSRNSSNIRFVWMFVILLGGALLATFTPSLDKIIKLKKFETKVKDTLDVKKRLTFLKLLWTEEEITPDTMERVQVFDTIMDDAPEETVQLATEPNYDDSETVTVDTTPANIMDREISTTTDDALPKEQEIEGEQAPEEAEGSDNDVSEETPRAEEALDEIQTVHKDAAEETTMVEEAEEVTDESIKDEEAVYTEEVSTETTEESTADEIVDGESSQDKPVVGESDEEMPADDDLEEGKENLSYFSLKYDATGTPILVRTAKRSSYKETFE